MPINVKKTYLLIKDNDKQRREQEPAALLTINGENLQREVKSIINKNREVAPKRMPLGARLAVNTQNMGGRFVESVKNARWLMSPQETGRWTRKHG